MADFAHSLVRRAVDVTHQHLNDEHGGEEHPLRQLALWGWVILWVTVILYMAMASAISYTYGEVVATLAMIETPTTDAYIAEPQSVGSEAPLLSPEDKASVPHPGIKDADVLLVKRAPVTAKLRTAVRHLRSVAGPLARFRGLHLAIIYHALESIITTLVSPLAPAFFRPVVAIFASVCLCRIHMTWTHALISVPNPKSWWQRVPSRKMAKKIVLPTALWATAQQVCLYVPGALFVSFRETMKHPGENGGDPQAVRKMALVESFVIVMIFVATFLLIVVPTEVSLKRVEASMLPEEEETVVPFDRSFAGNFKPEALGGAGAVSVLDAWKTFGKEGRIRLIKLYGKIFAMQSTLAILFTMVMIGELRMMLGGDFERLVEVARKSIKGEL